MSDSNVNLLPLAALQNLVGRNSNMSNEDNELSVKESLIHMPSLTNNSSITITKTKSSSGGHFSNGTLEMTTESEGKDEKSFGLSLLNNPSCTITRIARSPSDDPDFSKDGNLITQHLNAKSGENNINSFTSISELEKSLCDKSRSQLSTDSKNSIDNDLISPMGSRSCTIKNKLDEISNEFPSMSGIQFSKKDILDMTEGEDNWLEGISMKDSSVILANGSTEEGCVESTSSLSINRVLGNDQISNIFESIETSADILDNDLGEGSNSSSASKNSLLSKTKLTSDIKTNIKDDECSNRKNDDSDQIFDSMGHVGVSGTSSIAEFKWDAICCIYCEANISDQEPKLLPCLHSACGKCLTREASQAANNKDEDIVEMFPLIYCPSCKKGFAEDSVIDNMFVSEVCEKESTTENNYCTSCSDEESASGFCTDCCEWLCDACIQAHKRVKVTKDHIIKVKDNMEDAARSQSSRKNLFCSIHAKEQLNLYCVTCDQLTCRDCQLMEHRDHKYKFSVEMASQMKEKLRKLIRDIRKKRNYIEAAKDLVTERRQQLMKRQDTVKSEINRLIDTFIDIIRQRGQVLNDQLQEVSNTKEEQLDKKTEVLNHLEKQANHCISVVESTLDSSSELSLLYSKKLLMDHVLKVDKDSPDVSLFDRFKAKLNSGDEISLRISNESRGLGKALKDVGYLLVDSRMYPAVASTTQETTSSSNSTSKCRSNQPSPVSESPSPRPSSQPTQAPAPVLPTNAIALGTTTPTYMPPSLPPFSMSQSPMMTPQPPLMTPQPPTLTPMHSHHQQQQMMQNTSAMHKFHNFGPCGTINPPGLVRIQPKPQLVPSMTCGQPTIKPTHMGHGHAMGGFPRMPHLTPQSVRHSDVSSVSSSTHPLGDTNHLRGLLGSGGSYKIGGYPQLMRLPQPSNQQFPPPQHSPQPPTQIQQHRMMEQSRRMSGPNMIFDPMNSQLAMAAVGMAPPIMPTAPMPPMNHPRTQLAQMMRTSQPVSMPSRDSSRQASPHSTQPARHGSPSWHTPHVTPQPNDSNSAAQSFDNSFKIMLGIASSASTVPSVKPSYNNDGKSNEGVSSSSVNNFKQSKSKDCDESSSLPDDRGKSVLSVLSTLVGGSTLQGSSQLGGPDSSSLNQQVQSTEDTNVPVDSDIISPSPPKKDVSDPNDDWCAVCWDGGDLVCCDYCPKVFHSNCHIPSLSHLPRISEKWQCMICRDIAQLPDHSSNDLTGKRKYSVPMSPKQLKIAQRILLELYCNYEASQPFRELVDRELTEYYEIIQQPMALEIIKKKLKPDSVDHYTCLEDYVKDIKLIFKNCYEFNPRETEIYQNARILEDFFHQLLEKWVPDVVLSDNDISDEGISQASKRRKKLKEDIVHIS